MPGVYLFGFAQIINLIRWKLGKTTVCQTYRETLPPKVGLPVLGVALAFFFNHVARGYPKR